MALLSYDLGPQVVAFSTTRQGGCSQGNYGEFNINRYCGDNEADIRQNREALCRQLGIGDDHLLMPHQTHGTCVVRIDEAFLALGDEARREALEGVDALMTDLGGVCIGVSTADCIPLLLHDERHHAVCAIHAGWRGTVARITEKAVEAMTQTFGTDPADIKAQIGPGISLASFEVGQEVYDAFSEASFPMEAISQRMDKWHIDLPACNRLQLIAAGVPSESVGLCGICTYEQHEQFFSARRLGIESGRIFTAIMLRQPNTFIFDLDGTLLNTLDDLAASTNYALRTHQLPEHSIDDIRRFVGNGVRKLIERAVPGGESHPQFETVLATFQQHYLQHSLDRTGPYEGITNTLRELKRRGCHLAVVSNKFMTATQQLVAHFFPEIEVAIGEHEAEGIKRKPAPDTVFTALRQLDAKASEAVYVGDSDVDIATARNAGLPCISVLWGFRDRDFLVEHGAVTFVNKPEEILQFAATATKTNDADDTGDTTDANLATDTDVASPNSGTSIDSNGVERHPLQPFLPEGAKVLFLGSFPPQRKRWCMDFYYPNFINDHWRIEGEVFFADRQHFVRPGEKAFDREAIVTFCREKGIAFYDTATAVRRLKDNASDEFLEVVEPTDIRALLSQLPHCEAIVTTGQKATDTLCQYFGLDTAPKVGGSMPLPGVANRDGHEVRLYRLPSSSRAYPLAFDKKVAHYRDMFQAVGIL